MIVNREHPKRRLLKIANFGLVVLVGNFITYKLSKPAADLVIGQANKLHLVTAKLVTGTLMSIPLIRVISNGTFSQLSIIR